MSPQADPQANTSPPASVRPKPPLDAAHAAARPESSALDEVTPKGLAHTARSKTAAPAPQSTLWKSSIDRPQLSERDSIFATTYLASDSPTSSPRTSARSISPHDDAPNPSVPDMAASAPPQRRLIDAPIFRRKQSTHPPIALQDHHALLATHFNSQKAIAADMGLSELRHSPPPFMSPVDSPLQRPVSPNRPDVDAVLDDRLENNEERSRNKAWREGKPLSFKGTGASDEALVDSDVDKKIDVTMAKVEQPSSARSRKASHYLRVFKDGDGSEDHKKRDSRTKERRPTEKALPILQEEKHAKPLGEISALTEQLQRLSRPSSAVQSPQTGPIESYFEKKPMPSDETSPSKSSHVEPPVGTDQGTTYARPLPNYVLDEIRSIANLTPGAQPGSSFSRSLPTSAAEKYQARVSTTARRQHGESNEYFRSNKEESTEQSPASDEEDSEREQISSALYFPHRRLKGTEQNVPEGQNRKAEVTGLQKTPTNNVGTGLKGHAQGEDDPTPQEVEISLQSQDTNQILHGDIAPISSGPEEDGKTLLATSVDAFSAESESESLAESTHSHLDYDSSATDDLGTTPTATNHIQPAKTPQIAQPQPPAPLDAVELKPYDHQVGGHSTVYRFSRRAVCKQLNNRENEFYETVEREHPELLEFLPRYVIIRFHLVV